MLRAAAKMGDGSKLVILGLSNINVMRLQNDQPIFLDLAEFDVEGTKLMIFAGETEEQIGADLQHLIGPDTKVRIDPRLFGGSD